MSTVRQQLIDLLSEADFNSLELSRALSVPEAEIFDHLVHIEKSARRQGRKLLVEPYNCLSCGFRFRDRQRYERPGRCPKCKGGHIRMATFKLTPA